MATAPAHLPHNVSHRHLVEALLIAALAFAAGVVVMALSANKTSTSGTVVGSGRVVTQVRSVPAFTALELAGSNNVLIRVGEPQHLAVQADDNLVGHVTTQVQDGRLVIGNTGSSTTSENMRVDVSVPSLSLVRLTGSGNVAVRGVRADNFGAVLSGSGVLHVRGRTDWLNARLTGSGQLEAYGIAARHVTAVIAGAGTIHLTATRSLDAAITGVGEIVYGGSPTYVHQQISGGGQIVRR